MLCFNCKVCIIFTEQLDSEFHAVPLMEEMMMGKKYRIVYSPVGGASAGVMGGNKGEVRRREF